MLEGLNRWVPQLGAELITDCGHWIQLEKPHEANSLLLDFLTDLAARAGGRGHYEDRSEHRTRYGVTDELADIDSQRGGEAQPRQLLGRPRYIHGH
jgi:hypothetical protein